MEDGDEEVYQTELVQLFSEEDEVRVFFEGLDEELNKVNQFYKTKESEFLERGEILNKQLEILLDLKRILNERRRKPNAGVLSRSWSSSPRNSDFSGSASESNEISTDSQTDEIIAALEKNGINFINSATRTKTKKGKPKMAMRIDIPATTPTRTITAVTSMLWEDLVNNPKKEGAGDFINRKKIQCAEKMIRGAFVELYRGLGLLKTYSSLNMVAFTKILKKFDKVSNQQASASYLKVVKRSHFISSDKIVRLMDDVESIFTKHFANNDRKKAMKFLRPQRQRESHMVTFFVGLFTGCFVSLFSVYAILAHLSGIFRPNSERSYVETVYPVFSVFALLSLHLFMYGCNLFMWKGTRINYNFIFEFQPSTALKYRDAFLICTTFMTSVVAAMVIHLLLRASGFSPNHVDAIPGILLLIFVFVLICPFDIFYRPTRYCFVRIIRNTVCSPFYKVLMVDFFMADQLTSQIPLMRHMESTACYFLAGSFKTHRYETCNSGRLYRELAYVISFLPYYWRAMQCARRWFDESDLNHLANMGKYVSAMVAAGARITYATQKNHLWLGIVLVTSVFATLYQLYWDFVKDWGLLNSKSKNLWLRDDLILKNKSFYYMSIALNIVLRVAWVETVMGFRFNNEVESRMLDFFLASLEVIRRGHWNFYRLETRAKKTLPESSKGFQVLQTAEKSYLSAPHHAELVERKWGGSTHITVEEVKKKIADLLREYVESGDAVEACRCIRELGVSFFHHEVVKRALVLAMEIRTAEPLILKLLKEASEEGLISSSQMAKGFARLTESLDDLALDIPSAKSLFLSLIPKAIAEGWLEFMKSSGEDGQVQAEDEKVKRFKEEVVTIIHEYFLSDDIPELIRSLEDLGMPECNPIFLKKLITLAMDRKNREKEMASVLLSALHIEIFSTDDIVNGFVMLLESAEDTALDILDASNELALFLARAVIDDVLAPLNLEEIGSKLPPNCSGSETVRMARSLIAARHAGERLLRCWGGGTGWAVEDAKDKILKLLEEYESGGVVGEACQCIRDLGMPFFNHEVVKKALVMAMEKKNDRMLDLLQVCFNEGLITINQMTKGFNRIKDGMDDLALDIPNAEEKFSFYVEYAQKKGWLLAPLGSSVADGSSNSVAGT